MFKNNFVTSTFLTSLGFAIALLIPVTYAKDSISLASVFGVFLISLFSVLAGKQLNYRLGVNRVEGFTISLEIVMGFSILSVLQLLLALVLKLSAFQAFSATAILITIPLLLSTKSVVQRNTLFLIEIKSIALDSAVIIFISLLTTLWCRELITAVNQAHETGILRAWPDIFLHSTQIISLQNYSTLTNQSLYLAGTEQPLYHVASYVISSFYANVSHELALNVATYFWVPVGLVLMGIGVYGFGSALSGRGAGFLATAAIFLLPDASMYGLKNGFLGFHWLVQTHPGSGYALGIVLVALGVFVIGVREKRFNLILSAAAISLLSVAFRIQVAAPAVIMFGMLVLICWKPKEDRNRKTAIYLILILIMIIVLLFESIDLAPHFLTGKYEVTTFFNVVHNMATTSYGQAYIHLTSHSFKILKWTLGYGLLLIATLGAILPILLILILKKLQSKEDRQLAFIPIILILSSLMIIVLLPVPADGDFTNFGHRQLVLMYSVCLTVLISWLYAFYLKIPKPDNLNKKLGFILVPILIAVGVTVPWQYGKNIQQPDLRADWAHDITVTKIPKGLFKTAAFIREHASIQDHELSSDLDPLAIVISLTEKQAFLSREALYLKFKSGPREIFLKRRAEFENLKKAPDYEALVNFGAEHNTRWFLKYPNDMPAWPKSLIDCSVFESNGFRVYDLHNRNCLRV